jgi:hypothetical protein
MNAFVSNQRRARSGAPYLPRVVNAFEESGAICNGNVAAGRDVPRSVVPSTLTTLTTLTTLSTLSTLTTL